MNLFPKCTIITTLRSHITIIPFTYSYLTKLKIKDVVIKYLRFWDRVSTLSPVCNGRGPQNSLVTCKCILFSFPPFFGKRQLSMENNQKIHISTLDICRGIVGREISPKGHHVNNCALAEWARNELGKTGQYLEHTSSSTR